MPARAAWRGIIEEYRRFLDVADDDPVVTLLEGATPLLHAPRLSERVGASVWLMVEGANPTGSFKDRGMSLAMTKALASQAKAVVCASTGNTSASAAAYAARAGVTCSVLVPEGQVAPGKLAQALAYGAQVVQVRGTFDRALVLVRELERRAPVVVVNSVNPHRVEGQQTASFEIVDALGDAPDVLCIPVGNAGNMTAYWRGFLAYEKAGCARSVPRLLGFQAAGAAPIVLGHPVEHPDTVASAIRIGNPANWQSALAAARASDGEVAAVSDEDIVSARRLLAAEEGVYCETASAASVAGLLRSAVPATSTVVCVLTGNGLKEPVGSAPSPAAPTDDHRSGSSVPALAKVVDADLDAVLAELDI